MQLLLIVDYIAYWARDVYRPSILKKIKSSIAGIAYDQVSLSNDSDIYSLHNASSLQQSISNWIPAPPTAINVPDFLEGSSSNPESVSHTQVLSFPMTETFGGAIRSTSIFDAEILGLRLTEQNTNTVLGFIRGSSDDENKSMFAARQLMSFLSRWDEFIALPEADLDYLHNKWTGDSSAKGKALSSSRPIIFYVLVEFAAFVKDPWEITKEITYLAVSPKALEIILATSKFKRPPPGTNTIPEKARQCNHAVWRAAIECLRLGSPSQHFFAALSCVRLSFYCLPERKHAESNPKAETIGFGYIRRPRLRDTIEKIHKFGEKQVGPIFRKFPFGTLAEVVAANPIQPLARDIMPKPEELTFIRSLKRRKVTSLLQEHLVRACERCDHVSKMFPENLTFQRTDRPTISEYGFVLVTALNLQEAKLWEHEMCIFTFDLIAEIDGNSALGVALERLLRNEKIFNTIRRPLTRQFEKSELYPRDTLWNLPLPYRTITRKQFRVALAWSRELQSHNFPRFAEIRFVNHWNRLQLLLYNFEHGFTFKDSRARAFVLDKDLLSRKTFYYRLGQDEQRRQREMERLHGRKTNVDIFGNDYTRNRHVGIEQLRVKGSGLP